jgi:hypothetical protein
MISSSGGTTRIFLEDKQLIPLSQRVNPNTARVFRGFPYSEILASAVS